VRRGLFGLESARPDSEINERFRVDGSGRGITVLSPDA
jgi:hypothetical protein